MIRRLSDDELAVLAASTLAETAAGQPVRVELVLGSGAFSA